MLSINTNLSSLIAQQSLSSSTVKLNQAIERMSTGFKINHAKDNAANYSISTSLTTKIGAYMVAEDNVAMGLDMLSTAEGSLNQISDKLIRLRDLATQAGNGTYGEQSLNAINSEVNALVDEINRLYSTTEYNGINLLKSEGLENKPVAGNSGFIEDVKKRDTSEMQKLSEIDKNSSLTSGTYAISSAKDLEKLAHMTNNGLIGADCEFVLANDINLEGIDWTPIGTSANKFTATFDGNGYKIFNLKIDKPSENMQGLFGEARASTIVNLGIVNVDINAGGAVGGIAGIGGNIKNCFTQGKIKATIYSCGGISGQNNGDIENCYSLCDVDGGHTQVGGITGRAMGTIQNCFTSGNITAKKYNVGGIVGSADGDIINCYTTGHVSTEEGQVGGIAGYTKGSIIDCHSTGDIYGAQQYVGGIVGGSSGIEISNCYSLGYISSEKYCVGGIAGGFNGTKMENCYSVGDIKGSYTCGGLIGLMRPTSEFTINNCYATGNLEINQGPAGGLIGDISVSSGTISNCYATGNVKTISDTEWSSAGGFLGSIGYADDSNITISILNSYATGNVQGYTNVSGFLGYLQADASCIIDNCYLTGKINNLSDTDDAGGFIGYASKTAKSMTIKNSYMLGTLNEETNAIFVHKGDYATAELVLENCYYNPEKVNSGCALVGFKDSTGAPANYLEDKVNTYSGKSPFNLERKKDWCELQVGINSDNNSSIGFNSAFLLNNLSDLRLLGLTNDVDYLNKIDTLIETISARQIEYGSTQNRLESALDEISTAYENLVSTRSTIRDADIAEESSAYIRQQILQQASATLLATANQSPSIALQLI